MGPVPIEPERAQRAELLDTVTGAIDAFLDAQPDHPASHGPAERELIHRLLAPPPEDGGSLEPLLDRVAEASLTGLDTAAGTHLSYIPTGAVYSSALARYLAAVLNRWTGASFASPGSVAIEQGVINWMTDLFGYGDGAAGVLLSGGSIANLVAAIAARTRLGEDFLDGVVYTSERGHHSLAKAARLAGLPAGSVRTVATADGLRMDPAALDAAIGADLAAGRRPMMVNATAGTTDTGHVDPLDAIAEVTASRDVWFHVDAAYGGFFVMTDRGRAVMAGIERADSITVDAHKSLLLPFGVGGLLVADGNTLIQANEGRGAYMQDVMDDPDIPHFFALGPELSRPFRGLDLWLPLHLHGVGAFRRELDRMLDLAVDAADRLRAVPRIELVGEPELSVVTFASTTGDAGSQRILDEVNATGVAHLSSTVVDDRFTVRMAFLSHRTTTAIMAKAVDAVAAAAAGL